MSDRTATGGRRQDGFTLIELLVVIVVLGILAGIVVFGVGKFRATANGAACQADVSAVSSAARAYEAVTGGYPRDLTDLTVGQYLKSAPRSGTWSFDATTSTVTRSPACEVLTSTAGATVQPSPAIPSAPSSSATAGTTAAPTTVGGTDTCTAAVSIDNSWPQGYQAAITVTNTRGTARTNWVATWTVPSGVTLANGWNATVTQSGTTMRAEAPSWAATLPAGGSWSVGFIAAGGSAPPPSDVTLDAARCR